MVNFLYANVLIIDSNFTYLIAQTGWVARTVLFILLIFSVISWAMIFQKLGVFKEARRDGERFLQLFRAARGLADPKVLSTAGSPFTAVYTAGFREVQNQVTPSGGKLKSLQAVAVCMQLAAAEEVRRFEKGMSWMATTGSITPFIGLFGTVWGVMNAFAGLGSAGAASLRAVAPGIAEALITTAAGLATAIPAVIFYNYFLQNIRDFAQRMDNFAAEVAALFEKTYS